MKTYGSAVPSATRTTRLVIVESPSKAKTIAGYLGPDYFVEASFGHVRDLPRNAADVPAKYKGESWARLGVDVDNGFHALYVVSPDRKQQIARLTKLAKEVDEIFLATDEDREGEAIAWHRSSGWFSTRSPDRPSRPRWPTPGTSTGIWSTRRRRAAFWTACTGTKSVRCCGRR
jgi:reverse gyrase